VKIDPDIHKGMHSVLTVKLGVTKVGFDDSAEVIAKKLGS
jgi:hypothetical protein